MAGLNRGPTTEDIDGSKIMLLVSVDWFALSHFKPLISVLVKAARDVVVVTQETGRSAEIEALGARVVDIDYRRASMNPRQEATTVRRLVQILKAEKPDVLHMVAMKPIVLGCLASRFSRVPSVVVHMTGLGHLAISTTLKTRFTRGAAFRIISGAMRSAKSWLLVENPDDLAFMEDNGVCPGARVTILGGAGIDPSAFPAIPQPSHDQLVVACVGRMIHSKGLDVLVEAYDLLNEGGVPVEIELYGKLDAGNPEALLKSEIDAWIKRPGVNWFGHVDDVHAVWRDADIAVLSARTREGMPRAVLEAAACARPLIVSEVPGCRHFVRDGVEGLIVPPEDAEALANAISRLAGDKALRARMGAAARQRVLDGFTERHVVDALSAVYHKVLGSA